ncbi:MAG: aminotransferase class III-fold pyridoxal phosphate-dependent enzyme [Thermoleophilaceae bacterium]
MAAVSGDEFVLERADGVWVWDTDGNRYVDACASMWYANLGHGRSEIAEAAAAQMRRLDAYTVFNDYGNPCANELADRLADLAPMDRPKVWLGSGGSDGIEAASKIARAHWELQGRSAKLHLIGRTNAYHGVHGFGTSLGGIQPNRLGWGPLMTATSVVPYDSVDALRAEIERLGADHVAAFFLEPIVGSGGVLLPPPGYIEGVCRVCRENDVLLIVDEVICGFGRLGTWFGIERWGVEPDMIVFAKGVTGGMLPIGGVVVAEHIAAPYWRERGGPVLRHGVTYAGHPVCCAAALAALDVYERDGLVPRGRQLEGVLRDMLMPLEESPAVGEVRAGTGFLAAVELRPELLAARPGVVEELLKAIRAAGAIVRPSQRAVAVAPPLTIEADELELVGEAVATGVSSLEEAALAELDHKPKAASKSHL